MIIANQIVSPVIISKPKTNIVNNNIDVIGTCISIGDIYCITAGHVVDAIKTRSEGSKAYISKAKDEKWISSEVIDEENIGADIGILKLVNNSLNLPKISWNLDNLKVLSSVITIGYPYGSHIIDDEHMILARSFQGYVVCTIPRYKPLGFTGSNFSIHELSFTAPRGLSGAPIFTNEDHIQVKGIIIGNNQTEMLVCSEIEEESDSNSTRRFERFERLCLGIAVRAVHIASLESSILGSKLEDHLRINGLLM